MIGQHNLQSRIEQLIENNTFPRFSIFVGPRGSGKKTFAKEIVKQFQRYGIAAYFMCPDVKIDTIRDIINGAYKIAGINIYIIPDADNMSNAAKNALLKVTEEPPNNAHFIMTLEDENNTLETIRSRAIVFHMDRYTPDEVEEYFTEKYDGLFDSEISIIRDLCETPGDIDTIAAYNVINFYTDVQLVYDNLTYASLTNVFKIPTKIALKDTDNGYDLRLFWKAFMCICVKNGNGDWALITSRYLQKLRTKGINCQMLIDTWILKLREEI